MTDPVQPVSALATGDPRPFQPEPAAKPASDAQSTRVEVSRADEAPVYVYRVLDEQSGRTLVEIPRRSADFEKDRPGAQLNTRV